ncbi:MAG TPA: GTP cyclohydrolase MptA [bacterium]|nr:GTP cyclohydrolase MptA [bacterium]
MNLHTDMQAAKPSIQVSLNRVGITGITKIITIGAAGKENLFYSQLDLFVDLSPDQTGVHMSRFSEGLIEAVNEVIKERTMDIESFARGLAASVLERQGACRSEVVVKAKYPVHKQTPISKINTQEIYTIISRAAARARRIRSLVGVEATGLTACPCAQEMVRGQAAESLHAQGFSLAQVKDILATVSLASHNQRGKGTLLLGTEKKIEAQDLVTIVEMSMSSPIYDLLKRPDEYQVIKDAHDKPRFVEDVVREMVWHVLERYPNLEDSAFVLAKQVNYEGIHSYDVFAEKHGTLEELRREVLQQEYVIRTTDLSTWLDPGC